MTRPRLRTAALLPMALLLAALPAGCGGDPAEAYCDTVAAQAEQLQRLSEQAAEPGSDLIGDTLDVFERLRADAPADIADEWDTVVFAWRGLADAVDASGVDITRFDPDGPPAPGTTAAQRRAVAAAAEELRSSRVREAVTGIEQHARDVCGTDLSGPGAGW